MVSTGLLKTTNLFLQWCIYVCLMFCTFTSTVQVFVYVHRNVAWHDWSCCTFTRNADKSSRPDFDEFILAPSSSVTDLLSWSEKDMRVHPQGDIHAQLVDFLNLLPIVALCLLIALSWPTDTILCCCCFFFASWHVMYNRPSSLKQFAVYGMYGQLSVQEILGLPACRAWESGFVQFWD